MLTPLRRTYQSRRERIAILAVRHTTVLYWVNPTPRPRRTGLARPLVHGALAESCAVRTVAVPRVPRRPSCCWSTRATTTSSQGPAMIEAEGLSKYYGSFAAIRDVSFPGPPGRSGGLSGSQRGRQEHDHEAADRLLGPFGRAWPGSPATTWRPTGWPARPGWATCRKTARSIPT